MRRGNRDDNTLCGNEKDESNSNCIGLVGVQPRAERITATAARWTQLEGHAPVR